MNYFVPAYSDDNVSAILIIKPRKQGQACLMISSEY